MEKKRSKKNQLLLLEDVINLGRKGDLAKAKPGFVRNFLLPQKKAVIADKRTIRIQERLKEERAKQAIQDKKDAEALALKLKEKRLTTTMKNDTQGHLYGSVASADIVALLESQEGITLDRRSVILQKPIKKVGVFEISLKLKEGVEAVVKLKVEGEIPLEEKKPLVEVQEEGEESAEKEAIAQDAGEELPTEKEKRAARSEEIEERTKD